MNGARELHLFVRIPGEENRFTVHQLFFDRQNREPVGFLAGRANRKIAWRYLQEWSLSSKLPRWEESFARELVFGGRVSELLEPIPSDLEDIFLVSQSRQFMSSWQWSIEVRWLVRSCCLLPRFCHAIVGFGINNAISPYSLPGLPQGVVKAAAQLVPAKGDVIGVTVPECDLNGAMLFRDRVGEDTYCVDVLWYGSRNVGVFEKSKLWSEYEVEKYGLSLTGKVCAAEVVRIQREHTLPVQDNK